ncbi:hypothetical protein [Neotamlana nanhaiensis]|nr:hypothetical protein [Tamlana nanhaiensis]
MKISKVLIGFVILLFVLFAFFEVIGEYDASFYLNCSIIPTIALIYFLFVKNRNLYFLLFLVFYSAADVIGMITEYFLYNYALDFEANIQYYASDYYFLSALYIGAYFFLLLKIAKSLSFGFVFKKLKIHCVVLLILNVYLIYVIQLIVASNKTYQFEYWIEMVYNILMLAVMSVALLNFFYRDNKKSLFLFLGALCIVFSEVIDIAIIYVAPKDALNILSTALALSAFFFFYQQARLENNINNFVFNS